MTRFCRGTPAKTQCNFAQIWRAIRDKFQGRFLAERIFSRIFIVEPPDFFSRAFVAGYFLLIFVGENLVEPGLPA